MTLSTHTPMPLLTSCRMTLVVWSLCAACAVPAAAGAQSPAVSLDSALAAMATYDGGVESKAVWTVRDLVRTARSDAAARRTCETALVTFLKSDATAPARLVAARYLRTLVSDAAVPTLASMLADARTSDLAMYVLQPLSGPVADNALVAALRTTEGPQKIAVINALGARRVSAAVPAIVRLLAPDDTSTAAAVALAQIGGPQAAAALTAALSTSDVARKQMVAAATLRAADTVRQAGRSAEALRLYGAVASAFPAPASAATADPVVHSLRLAAARGQIVAAGPLAQTRMIEYLKSADLARQEAAVSALPGVTTKATVTVLCTALPGLPEPTQIQLIAALGSFPGPAAAAAIRQRIEQGSDPVKLAALKAYPSAQPGAGAVTFLVGVATSHRGPVQVAARAALANLRGEHADAEVVAGLAKGTSDAQTVELLTAVSERRLFLARETVAGFLSSSARPVRIQALRTLRVVGTPSDLAGVIDVLVASDDDREIADAELTISSLGAKTTKADTRARPIRQRIDTAKSGEARARLIGILPLLGDDTVLPVVRTAVDAQDPLVAAAAVRALAAWPGQAVRDDLWALARTGRDESYRLIGLAGVIRLLGAEPARKPESAVADLEQALGLATRPEERKLVLGTLPTFPCRAATELATRLLQDPDVSAEAKAAIEQIRMAMSGRRFR